MNNKIVHVEWIGTHIEVVHATNQSLIGMEGVVVDETKHALVLKTPKGEQTIPKKGTQFQLIIKNKSYVVQGDDFLISPEKEK